MCSGILCSRCDHFLLLQVCMDALLCSRGNIPTVDGGHAPGSLFGPPGRSRRGGGYGGGGGGGRGGGGGGGGCGGGGGGGF